MDAELTRLLGYLDQDGVTELVLGSGQPITIRRGGSYTAASTDIVSRPQLARWLLGSGFESLLPDGAGIGEPGDVEVGARRYAVQITRRGEDLLVRVEHARAAPPPIASARTRSRAIKRPTSSPATVMQPMAPPAPAAPPAPSAPPVRAQTAPPVRAQTPPAGVVKIQPVLEPEPPLPDLAALNAPSVLELGPPGQASVRPDLVGAPDAPAATYAMLPDLMPEGPLAVTPPVSRPPPAEAPRRPTPLPVAAAAAVAAAPSPVRAETPRGGVPLIRPPQFEPPLPPGAESVRAPETSSRTITGQPLKGTPPADAPVPRAPRTRSAEASALFAAAAAPAAQRTPTPGTGPHAALVPVAPRVRSLRDADEKPNTDLIAQVVRAARQRGASDLHVAANRPLLIRAIGELIPLDRTVLPPADVEALLLPLLGVVSRELLAARGYVDIAVEIRDAGRLRGNISRVQGGLKGSFRLAYPQPPTLEELNLPKELAKVVSHHQGLVVIAGPSGHGKTTTLAALVDLINSTRPHHILTIEDPVEIEHPRKRAVVTQREVGRHTKSFAAALKASLREDPDVIVIGELRDRETVEIALTAAETGHLVLATMSTPSAAKTIDRLIDMFPPDDQQQVRSSLGGALRAIVAQRLVPRIDNGAVLPAIELLTGVLPLVSLIRDNKLFQLPNLMQRGRAFGMIRLDDSLADLVRAGMIAEEAALRVADNRRDLLAALRGPLAAAAAPGQPAAAGAPAGGSAAPPAPAKKGGLGGLFGRKDRE